MKCSGCGVEVDASSVYCHKCGERLDGFKGPEPPADMPSERAMPESSDTSTDRLRDAIDSVRQNNNELAEQELWEGGYCGKAMMGAWILSGLISIALLILAAVIWNNAVVWYLVLGAIVLLWGYQLVTFVRRRLGVHYRLTSQRFFHEKGVLVHTTDLIEVIDMDDITYRQTLIDRCFDVGTIRIVSSDRSHPDLSIDGIAGVKDVAAKLHEARHTERIRRGLHIESI